MDPRLSLNQIARFSVVVAISATATACQKTRNSSKPAPQPMVAQPGPLIPPTGPRPIFTPPGVMVPPVGPGPVGPGPVIVVPSGPTQPPQPTGPVVPPRVTPPGSTQPPTGSQPPVATIPPVDPGTPRVTPLPQPQTPAQPPVAAQPPVGAQPPVIITTPGAQSPAPVVTPAPQPSGGVTIIVDNPQRGQIDIAQPAPATRAVGGAGATPVILGNARVVTPIRSEILSTCTGAKCAPSGVPFMAPCQDQKHCDIQTILVERRQQLTCPEIELRTRPHSSKLDILFVVDTSASMKQERVEIARQMTHFMKELSPDVTYRIGVMLGHGPRSKTAKVGDLFDLNKGSSSVVIPVESLLVGARARLARTQGLTGAELEKAAREDAAQLAANRLAEGMASLPNDNSETQGEAGLLNLYTSVKSGQLARLKSEGTFWTDDAAKAVIFVADENDVCFDYDEASREASSRLGKQIKIEGRYNTETDRRNERAAFEAGDVCRASADGGRLTPKKVFDAVVASSRLPVIFSGILYLDNNTIPQRGDKYAKDNEMGHGYLDVIALGLGKAADLGKGDFGSSLAKIGDFSNFRMKYDHVFPMQNVKDVRDIDPTSIYISITDPSGVERTFNGSHVKLEINEANNSARVVIDYEILENVYADGLVKAGSKIVIRYSTKSGEGRPAATAMAATTAATDVAAAPTASAPAAAATRAALPEDSVPLAPVEDKSIRAPKKACDKGDGREYWALPVYETDPFTNENTGKVIKTICIPKPSFTAPPVNNDPLHGP